MTPPMTPTAELRELHAKGMAGLMHLEVFSDGEDLKRVRGALELIEAYRSEIDRLTGELAVAREDIASIDRQATQWSADAEAAEQRCADMEKALADPVAVHANMLRGGIAKPSPANIWHLYGDEALLAAMPESARALAQTGRG